MEKMQIHKDKHNPERGTKRRLWCKKTTLQGLKTYLIIKCAANREAMQTQDTKKMRAKKSCMKQSLQQKCSNPAGALLAEQLERQTGRPRTADKKVSSKKWHI